MAYCSLLYNIFVTLVYRKSTKDWVQVRGILLWQANSQFCAPRERARGRSEVLAAGRRIEMGICGSSDAQVAPPPVIIPDPAPNELCTFTVKKVGRTRDYTAYKGDLSDDKLPDEVYAFDHVSNFPLFIKTKVKMAMSCCSGKMVFPQQVRR
jgi:hypothetical protein